jgi:hypothetical protein
MAVRSAHSYFEAESITEFMVELKDFSCSTVLLSAFADLLALPL